MGKPRGTRNVTVRHWKPELIDIDPTIPTVPLTPLPRLVSTSPKDRIEITIRTCPFCGNEGAEFYINPLDYSPDIYCHQCATPLETLGG